MTVDPDLAWISVTAALIDSCRLRGEDEYTVAGEVSTQSLYGGGNPLPDFRRYLNLAEK